MSNADSKQTSYSTPNLDFPGFWTLFGTMAKAAEPIGRNNAKIGLELQSLAGQRSRAYMGIPETIGRCQTPMDLFQAQVAFWQTAARQYAESTQRISSTWQALLPGGTADATKAGAAAARDFLSFPDMLGDMPRDEQRKTGEPRRAA